MGPELLLEGAFTDALLIAGEEEEGGPPTPTPPI